MNFSSHIKAIILFGSRAKGCATESSDTDVAVLADRPLSNDDENAIIQFVTSQVKQFEEKIDLIDLARASPLLQQSVATDGRLLWGDSVDFLRFRVLAWKRYLDTAKLRRARENFLIKKYA